MKNKLFKVIPTLIMGVSLTACTILSDLGIGGKKDITKMAKFKNEVSLTEFVDKLKNSAKDTDYVKEGYQLPDSKLIAGVKAEAKQQFVSPSYKNKTRNEASFKANATLDASYDKDNESIMGGLEASYSYSEENATAGKASAKYENDLDVIFMPNGLNQYALVHSEENTYYRLPTGADFKLNQVLSLGMGFFMNTVSNVSLGSEFNETEFNKALAQYGLSLKYYDDSNVMTIAGDWNYTFDVGNRHVSYSSVYNEETGMYEQHEEVIEDYWGKATLSAKIKVQFKVVKVVKFRASFDGSLKVDYTKDHVGLYNNYYPFGITGLTGDCQAGDQETITAKVEAGINLEHEKVENKLPDLSKYKDITPKVTA